MATVAHELCDVTWWILKGPYYTTGVSVVSVTLMADKCDRSKHLLTNIFRPGLTLESEVALFVTHLQDISTLCI